MSIPGCAQPPAPPSRPAPPNLAWLIIRSEYKATRTPR
jgi:hypothetical protein